MPVPTTRPTSAGTPTADVADVTFHYPVRPDITLDADDNLEELGELIVQAVTPEPIPDFIHPEGTVPVFNLQVNTQANELQELRRQQPVQIIHNDYQQLVFHALANSRMELREKIRNLRKYAVTRDAYFSFPTERERKFFISALSGSFLNRTLREIEDPHLEIRRTRYYASYHDARTTYMSQKTDYLINKERYGAQQARYNQQIAMIRQRPRPIVAINGQEIVDQLMQWDNIWGVAVKNCGEYLKVRIGLNDIVMSESAPVSRYDNAADITLAPFVITIKLDDNGSFICSSSEENAIGLSREGNEGHFYHDFHPHQLSDTPCFGTFGQTFNDMASKGQIIDLVGGLIAFYSQYNSNDSAGVSASGYHPGRIRLFNNARTYAATLSTKVRRLTRFAAIDQNKLREATARYVEYHNDTSGESPPRRRIAEICGHCEECPVSDNDNYYVVNGGRERVCEDCWNEYYCMECENHREDCTCDDDDDGSW